MRGGSRRFGLRKPLFRSQRRWIGEGRRADQPRGWSAASRAEVGGHSFINPSYACCALSGYASLKPDNSFEAEDP